MPYCRLRGDRRRTAAEILYDRMKIAVIGDDSNAVVRATTALWWRCSITTVRHRVLAGRTGPKPRARWSGRSAISARTSSWGARSAISTISCPVRSMAQADRQWARPRHHRPRRRRSVCRGAAKPDPAAGDRLWRRAQRRTPGQPRRHGLARRQSPQRARRHQKAYRRGADHPNQARILEDGVLIATHPGLDGPQPAPGRSGPSQRPARATASTRANDHRGAAVV